MTTRARTVDIRESDSPQAVSFRVIENPQVPAASPKLTGSKPRHSAVASTPTTASARAPGLDGFRSAPWKEGQPGETGTKFLGITLSPLQRAHSQMVAELSLLAPSIPVLSADPDADEIRAFEPHMVKVAEAVDRYFAAIGRELHSHVLGVDLDMFDLPCLKAISGNALYECQSAVEAVEEGTDIRTGMWSAE